jgi:hypothetical protein
MNTGMKLKIFRFLLIIAVAFSLTNAASSYGQAFLTNGLIAYYPFNGNANDASGNGYDGIVSSNCWFTPDRFAKADHAIFVTNDQSMADQDVGRIDIPAPVLDSMTSGTISAWINPNDVISGDIVAKQHSGVNSYAVFSIGSYCQDGQPVLGNPGTLYFSSQNYNPVAASTSTVTTKAWQHVAVVFTDSSCVFYINGTPCGTNTGNYSIPGDLEPTTTSIGCWYGEGWSSTNFLRFVGSMDDVRIYANALSAAEVKQLYQIENAQTKGSPKLSEGKAIYVKASNLTVGYSYQPQTSNNSIRWVDAGPPFTAMTTSMVVGYWEVEGEPFYFRLH